MHVKIFTSTSLISLERQINDWLYEQMPEKLQIQYDSGWSVDNVPEYTVVILYEDRTPFGGMETKALATGAF